MVPFGKSAARNARTRPGLLERLARSSNPEVVELVARNPSTPSGSLADLGTGESMRVLVAAAGNPSTPDGTLEALSRHCDGDVRTAVAGNPATSATVLDYLVKAAGRSERILLAVAANQAASPQTLARLAETKSSAIGPIREALAANRATPTRTRAELFGIEELRGVVIRTAPLETVAQRVAHTEKRPSLGHDRVLALLAADANEDVRRAVPLAPRFDHEIVEGLTHDDARSVADVATARIATDPALLAELASSEDGLVLAALVRNSNTPVGLKPGIARRLLADGSDGTLQLIANDASTPGDVLLGLARHSSAIIRRHVASNPSTPVEGLPDLAADAEANVRTITAKATRLPLKSIVALAGDLEPKVREAVAGNSSTPPKILLRLASDEDLAVAKATARNEAATGPVLQRIVDTHGAKWRESHPLDVVQGGHPLLDVAANPKTPPGALRLLANVQGKSRVQAVPKRSHTKMDVFRWQVEAQNRIRVAVAGNPSAPAELLAELAQRVRENTRRLDGYPIWHRLAPDGSLEPSLDPDEREREQILSAMVENPATPIETLHSLSSGDWVADRTRERYEREDGHRITSVERDTEATKAAKEIQASRVRTEISRRLVT